VVSLLPIKVIFLNSYSPEQIEKAKCFYEHTDDGPLAKDEEHAGKEADGSSNLLFPREKIESLLWSDEKRNTGGEEHIPKRQKRSIEEE